MPTFTEIALGLRDLGSDVDDALGGAFLDRDEDLRERPTYLELAETEEGTTSYVQKKAWQLYIPQVASQLNVAIQVRIQSVTSGEVRCKIGGLTSSVVSTTNTSYGTTVFDCNFSDVSSIQGTEVIVTLEAKITGTPAGGRWVRVREADGPASYFVE